MLPKYIEDFNMQCWEIDTNILLPAKSPILKGINIFKNSHNFDPLKSGTFLSTSLQNKNYIIHPMTTLK